MATIKLTDKTILATRPAPKERVELWDETTPGLCLRVSNPTAKNEGPERIRIAIPAGLLKPGRNILGFSQEGTKAEPAKRDNLGLLGIAIDFESDVFSQPGRP